MVWIQVNYGDGHEQLKGVGSDGFYKFWKKEKKNVDSYDFG